MSLNGKDDLSAPLLGISSSDSNSLNSSKVQAKSRLDDKDASQSSAGTGDINVTTSDVVFQVHVPRVKAPGSSSRGTSEKVLSLPKDEAELPKVLELQEPTVAPSATSAGSIESGESKLKNVQVDMSAKLNISGQNPKGIANAAHTASFAFHQLVNEFEKPWMGITKQRSCSNGSCTTIP